MGSQPTPEEAANALKEVAERREQAASPDAHPAWTLWVIAVAAVALGVASDLRPELGTPLLYVFVAGALLLTFLPRWKRPAAAMGYRRSPDPRGMPARARMLRTGVLLALMVLFAVGGMALRAWEVPFPATIAGVVAVAAVLLMHRVLDRAARAPRA